MDLLRKTYVSPSIKREKIVISHTASYDVGNTSFSSWKLGNLCLTQKRLLFSQVRKVLFQIPLKEIPKVVMVERKWILGKRIEQLCIFWNKNRIKKTFIAVKDPQKWIKTIEALIACKKDNKSDYKGKKLSQ